MNTDCAAYRESLRARFDDGAPLGPEAPDHADHCAACAAYRSELCALDDAFAAMPFEVPRNALAHRVKARLAAEPAYTNDARWWLPAAAALACSLVIGAAWYFAVPVDPWTWWDYANRSGATPAWMLREISFNAELATAQAYWGRFAALLAPFSSSLVWTVVAAAALVLAGVNGAEAYRLRTAANPSRQWR